MSRFLMACNGGCCCGVSKQGRTVMRDTTKLNRQDTDRTVELLLDAGQADAQNILELFGKCLLENVMAPALHKCLQGESNVNVSLKPQALPKAFPCVRTLSSLLRTNVWKRMSLKSCSVRAKEQKHPINIFDGTWHPSTPTKTQDKPPLCCLDIARWRLGAQTCFGTRRTILVGLTDRSA